MTRPDGSPELRRRRSRGEQLTVSHDSSPSDQQEYRVRGSRHGPLNSALLRQGPPVFRLNCQQPARMQPAPVRPTATSNTVSMPYFLQLNETDIGRKFNDLNTRERLRMEIGYDSPTGSWAVCNQDECLVLDRYMNVQPWAKNRCKLKVAAGQNNYVNASPISLHEVDSKSVNKFKYIAMQGPKYNTVSHTWRLIWEQTESPAVIVMLTDFEEAGREKCARYFPRDSSSSPIIVNAHDEFEDGFRASVHFVKKEKSHQDAAIEVRKLVMRVKTVVPGNAETGEEDVVNIEEKIVWHLLYKHWPDFGVPEIDELDSFFALMKLSREKNTVPNNPRIVHCSAGVGRSGTFIALEFLLEELEAGNFVFRDGRDTSLPHLPTPVPQLQSFANYYHYTPAPPMPWGLHLPPPVFNLPLLIQNPAAYEQRYQNPGGVGSPVYQAADAAGEKDLIYETVDNLRIQRKMMVQADCQYHFLYRVLRRCWQLKYTGVAGPAVGENVPGSSRVEGVSGASSVDSQDPFI